MAGAPEADRYSSIHPGVVDCTGSPIYVSMILTRLGAKVKHTMKFIALR